MKRTMEEKKRRREEEEGKRVGLLVNTDATWQSILFHFEVRVSLKKQTNKKNFDNYFDAVQHHASVL